MAALSQTLIGYWPLAGDANSGGGTISTALTAVNSPTYESVAGVGTMAAYVAASSQKHTLADSASWNFEDISWCLYCIWRPASISVARVILSKLNATGNQRSFELRVNAGNNVFLRVHDKTTNTTSAVATNTSVTAAVGGIYHIFAGYQHGATNPLFCEVNGAVATSSLGSVVTIKHVTESFCVGGLASAVSATTDGNIGRVSVWSGYVPTPRERAWIRTRPQFSAFNDVFRNRPKRPSELIMV